MPGCALPGTPLADEAKMLDEQTHVPPLDSLEPVAGADDIRRLAEQAREIYVEESLSRYVVALLRTTRARRCRAPW